MNIKPYSVCVICVFACVFLGACHSISRIPAKGEFLGSPVDTTVDSEVARYYLERHTPGTRENQEWDNKIAALYNQYGNSIPSREELRKISQTYSVDFASLFFADRLLNDPCNQEMNRLFLNYLNTAVNVDARAASAYLVLFVPGWDYVENAHFTGADFAKPRQLATQYGFENYLVAIPPTGSVEESAKVLAAEIARRSRSGKEILLVGTSAAGPVIHLTLGELLDQPQRHAIKAWINIAGILQGSPLVDYFEDLPQRWVFNMVFWYKNWEQDAIRSMGTGPSRRRFARLRLDPDMMIINYLGVPLSGQLSQYSGQGYRLLRPQGPNDGLALLTDVAAPGSLTVVALGNDHYFGEDPQIDKKTVALMQLILTYLNKDRTAGCLHRQMAAG